MLETSSTQTEFTDRKILQHIIIKFSKIWIYYFKMNLSYWTSTLHVYPECNNLLLDINFSDCISIFTIIPTSGYQRSSDGHRWSPGCGTVSSLETDPEAMVGNCQNSRPFVCDDVSGHVSPGEQLFHPGGFHDWDDLCGGLPAVHHVRVVDPPGSPHDLPLRPGPATALSLHLLLPVLLRAGPHPVRVVHRLRLHSLH